MPTSTAKAAVSFRAEKREETDRPHTAGIAELDGIGEF